MDIVLNGFCKQSASYRKCLGKSSTYKRTSANGVVHRKKFSNFYRYSGLSGNAGSKPMSLMVLNTDC